MPHKPRLFIPAVPVHLVVRGHDRRAIVKTDEDRECFIQFLGLAARTHGLAVHAWVLMTNHLHLLATPAQPTSLGATMKHTGVHYTRYFNRRYRRKGTLWAGRYKTSFVGGGEYLLACYRYIESNPVRVGMVEQAIRYPWSSHACNAWGYRDPLVTPHPVYLAIDQNEERRRQRYRALFNQQLAPGMVRQFRKAAARNAAVGTPDFHRWLARSAAESGTEQVGSNRTRGTRGGSVYKSLQLGFVACSDPDRRCNGFEVPCPNPGDLGQICSNPDVLWG